MSGSSTPTNKNGGQGAVAAPGAPSEGDEMPENASSALLNAAGGAAGGGEETKTKNNITETTIVITDKNKEEFEKLLKIVLTSRTQEQRRKFAEILIGGLLDRCEPKDLVKYYDALTPEQMLKTVVAKPNAMTTYEEEMKNSETGAKLLADMIDYAVAARMERSKIPLAKRCEQSALNTDAIDGSVPQAFLPLIKHYYEHLRHLHGALSMDEVLRYCQLVFKEGDPMKGLNTKCDSSDILALRMIVDTPLGAFSIEERAKLDSLRRHVPSVGDLSQELITREMDNAGVKKDSYGALFHLLRQATSFTADSTQDPLKRYVAACIVETAFKTMGSRVASCPPKYLGDMVYARQIMISSTEKTSLDRMTKVKAETADAFQKATDSEIGAVLCYIYGHRGITADSLKTLTDMNKVQGEGLNFKQKALGVQGCKAYLLKVAKNCTSTSQAAMLMSNAQGRVITSMSESSIDLYSFNTKSNSYIVSVVDDRENKPSTYTQLTTKVGADLAVNLVPSMSAPVWQSARTKRIHLSVSVLLEKWVALSKEHGSNTNWVQTEVATQLAQSACIEGGLMLKHNLKLHPEFDTEHYSHQKTRLPNTSQFHDGTLFMMLSFSVDYGVTLDEGALVTELRAAFGKHTALTRGAVVNCVDDRKLVGANKYNMTVTTDNIDKLNTAADELRCSTVFMTTTWSKDRSGGCITAQLVFPSDITSATLAKVQELIPKPVGRKQPNTFTSLPIASTFRGWGNNDNKRTNAGGNNSSRPARAAVPTEVQAIQKLAAAPGFFNDKPEDIDQYHVILLDQPEAFKSFAANNAADFVLVGNMLPCLRTVNDFFAAQIIRFVNPENRKFFDEVGANTTLAPDGPLNFVIAPLAKLARG